MVYIARGYPPDLIKSWLRDNTSKRWRNRHGKSESEGDVFVLKSHFNPVWTAFNIHELGRLVTSHWLDFLEAQDEHNRQLLGPQGTSPRQPLKAKSALGLVFGGAEGAPANSPSPPVSPVSAGPEVAVAAPLIMIPRPLGRGGHIEERLALDIRKLGYHERKWLVSRKRNFNLFDLVAKLKQSVLYLSFDNDVIMDGIVDNWD
jgi:hypothetical protein